jgi:hypothetical protein
MLVIFKILDFSDRFKSLSSCIKIMNYTYNALKSLVESNFKRILNTDTVQYANEVVRGTKVINDVVTELRITNHPPGYSSDFIGFGINLTTKTPSELPKAGVMTNMNASASPNMDEFNNALREVHDRLVDIKSLQLNKLKELQDYLDALKGRRIDVNFDRYIVEVSKGIPQVSATGRIPQYRNSVFNAWLHDLKDEKLLRDALQQQIDDLTI